jgi:hypothetical protein
MPTMPETPSERVALVAWYMAFGVALSTKEIAKLTGLSKNSTLRLMWRISRVLPIYQDETRIWRRCESDSTAHCQ